MNKSIVNAVEIGVNLILAVAVIGILAVVMRIGRDNVNTIEQQRRYEKQAQQSATFGELNGAEVTYGRVIELVTCNAGKYDIYVDSTVDGGAILISQHIYNGTKSTTDAKGPNGFVVSDSSKRIGYVSSNGYPSLEKYMNAQVKELLKSDISTKFATGKWRVYLAVNSEFVGTAAGTTPGTYNEVTGLRFERIE